MNIAYMDLEAYASRFWSSIDRRSADACWPWLRYRNKTTRLAYGKFNLKNVGSMKAHRAAWILTNGLIPDGLCVCHRCDNPACCNPSHLFLATHAENNHDRDAKGRTVISPWHGKTENFSRGSGNPSTKMNEQMVAEIRRSSESCKALGERLGLSHSAVHRARCGDTWAWLKAPPPWPKEARHADR